MSKRVVDEWRPNSNGTEFQSLWLNEPLSPNLGPAEPSHFESFQIEEMRRVAAALKLDVNYMGFPINQTIVCLDAVMIVGSTTELIPVTMEIEVRNRPTIRSYDYDRVVKLASIKFQVTDPVPVRFSLGDEYRFRFLSCLENGRAFLFDGVCIPEICRQWRDYDDETKHGYEYSIQSSGKFELTVGHYLPIWDVWSLRQKYFKQDGFDPDLTDAFEVGLLGDRAIDDCDPRSESVGRFIDEYLKP